MAETITIYLNTQAQTQGITATVNGLRNLKLQADSVISSFSRFATRVIAPLASLASVGMIAKLTKDAIEHADAMGKTAQKAGIAVETFTALSYAAGLADVSSENLITATRELSKWMEKNGQSGRDLTEVFLEQSDVIARAPEGMSRLRLAQEMFGRSSQALLPLLNQGSEAIRQQMEEAKEFGAVIGPRFSSNSNTFNDNLTRIHTIFKGIFLQVSQAVLPSLIALSEEFIRFVRDNGIHIGAINTLIDGFKILAFQLNDTAYRAEVLHAVFSGANWGELGAITQRFESMRAQIEGIQKLGKIEVEVSTSQKGNAAPVAVGELENMRLLLEANATRMALVDKDATISARTRNSDLKAIYAERLTLLKTLEKQIADTVSVAMVGDETGVKFTKEYAEASKELNGILKERADIQEKLYDIDAQETFFGRFRDGMRDWNDSIQTFGASVADVMLGGVKNAIDTVANGIWQIVDGTATWGQLFVQVGRQIISQMIAIALQQIIVRGLTLSLAAVMEAVGAIAVATHLRTFAAGALAGVGTSGSQGGPYAIVIYLAVLAAAIAAVTAMTAFKEGGIISGGPQVISVNEDGRQEAVLNARATAMLGADRIAALNAGIMDFETRMVSSVSAPIDAGAISTSSGVERGGSFGDMSGGSRGGSQPINLNILLVDSRNAQAARDWAVSSDGQTVIAEVVRNQKLEIGVT